MKSKLLRNKIERQELKVLKARIDWAKKIAELDVLEDTLKSMPDMGGFEDVAIE